MVMDLPAAQETQVPSVGWEDPLEDGMATHSSILPGKSSGQRSLVGYINGVTESDTAEATELTSMAGPYYRYLGPKLCPVFHLIICWEWLLQTWS